LLKVDEHENFINELSQLLKIEGVDQAKVSTILQSMRENYSEVGTSFTANETKFTEINKLNEDLRNANMMLLSKLGTQSIDSLVKPNGKEKEKETETEEKTMTLDELTDSFLK
jgi:hydrogenase maturation factor